MLEANLGEAWVAMAFAGRLGDAKMRLFHPLGFMLASPVETPEEAVERFTAKPVSVAVKKKRTEKSVPQGAKIGLEVERHGTPEALPISTTDAGVGMEAVVSQDENLGLQR